MRLICLYQKHADFNTHAQALTQKYMGLRNQGSNEGTYRDTSIHPDEDLHTVPVSNFLNAQCKSTSSLTIDAPI